MNDQIIMNAFQSMPRIIPGSDASTKRAMTLYGMPRLPSRILVLGCGHGKHVFLLAKKYPRAEIYAIDTNAQYVEEVNQYAAQEKLHIQAEVMDYDHITYDEESFELIWVEGVLTQFGKEIAYLRTFLKPHGFCIVGQLSYLKDANHAVLDYFKDFNTEIDYVEHNVRKCEEAIYEPRGYFVEPLSDWEAYYNELMQELHQSQDGQNVIPQIEKLKQLQQDNPDAFSYVYYAMQKEENLAARKK